MDNNDRLIRLRYALDIKDTDMIKIFKLGGIELTKEEVRKVLTKSKDSFPEDIYECDELDDYYKAEENEEDDNIKCNDRMLESFLSGFITFKRGKQEPKPGQPEKPAPSMKNGGSVNNMMLKKLKIALSLTSEDMLNTLEEGGVTVTKGELGAIFRKEGHKHYRECGDNYARKFLRGLALKNRK